MSVRKLSQIQLPTYLAVPAFSMTRSGVSDERKWMTCVIAPIVASTVNVYRRWSDSTASKRHPCSVVSDTYFACMNPWSDSLSPTSCLIMSLWGMDIAAWNSLRLLQTQISPFRVFLKLFKVTITPSHDKRQHRWLRQNSENNDISTKWGTHLIGYTVTIQQ